MTEQERIDLITQHCRSARYPEPLVEAICASLAGKGTLEQAQTAWQAAKGRKRYLHVAFITLSDARSGGFDTLDLRILDLCLAVDSIRPFLGAIMQESRFDQAYDHLLKRGVTEQQMREWQLDMLGYAVDGQGQPTRLGQRLLASIPDHFDEMLALIVERMNHGYWLIPAFVNLLVAAQPPYLDLAWQVTQRAQQHEAPYHNVVGQCARILLKADPARFTPWAREIASRDDKHYDWSRVVALQALLEQDVAQHIDLALAAARTPIPSRKRWNFVQYQLVGLRAAYRFDPVNYWPLVEEAALSSDYQLGQQAIKLLGGASFDLARPVLQRCVASTPGYTALPALELLLKTPWEGQQGYALSLLAHRSKQIRERASKWLAAQGEAIIDEIASLLTHRSADARLAAAEALQRIGGARVQGLLAARLDSEKAQRVREAILDVVGVPGTGAASQNGARPSPIEAITAEAEATLTYLPTPVLAWFDAEEAPALYWNTGEPVPPVVLRYVLYRQSRRKGERVEEANRQTLAQIDRATAGDLARALFKDWISKGAKSEETWLLPLVGALGDERLAAPLRQRIESWGLGNRRTLAAQAMQALALLESEAAQVELQALVKVFTHGKLRASVKQALDAAASV